MTTADSPTSSPREETGANRLIQARVATVQDGARLHYAVPLAMERAGILHTMFAEWFDRPWSLESAIASVTQRMRPQLAKKLRSRTHPRIPREKVRTHPLLVLQHQRATKNFQGQPYHAECSRLTGNWVRRQIESMRRHEPNLLHGYVRNIDPGLCEYAQQHRSRIKTIGDQIIAPAAEEIAQLKKQRDRFPDWEQNAALRDLELYAQYEQRTWKALDHVLCPSPYVRGHLIAQGVSEDRISLLPYPIDAWSHAVPDRTQRQGQPVTVGFVGAVNLRKGAPFFLQVARRFDPQRVRFVMVGKVQLHEQVISEFAPHVQLVGPVPRDEVAPWMNQFDIFMFPSTCEGSAGAVMEAMASGLPIVTSPNSGSVVTQGHEGYVAPYDDVDKLAGLIEILVSSPELRHEMGRAARAKAESLDLDWYSRKLRRICIEVYCPALKSATFDALRCDAAE